VAAKVLDPAEIARSFRAELREEIALLGAPLTLVGFLSADHGPSKTYADYTRKGCEDVGVSFDLRHVTRLEAEPNIERANADPTVHGILVYYPVFGTEHDVYLRDLILPEKDIEGLHSFWARCLYANRRFVDDAQKQKAILPCTPLAILKLLEAGGAFGTGPRPLAGKRIAIFNRSEVVGRPLASMLANDGAEVVSFDVDGPQVFAPSDDASGHEVRESSIDRRAALAAADVVITGVPSRSFELIGPSEIKRGAICLSFSTAKNFTDDIALAASVYIPRVGPMTVTMALRNTLRLYRNAIAR
jgi:5,10-methylene-tetrahydrofolate dehydrogenase/methenyl tetrahydrofolate cyclohydrolase